mmetsp:Transcript_41966/g.76706  ORF Transcript_41966/g.76706 Transcript_41966/m.76706 type:complete len:146 (+) Transcript_41966:259-696(+)
MLGQQWAAGGGAGGANGPGAQAMNARIGGCHGINIGAMGYNPRGQTGMGGVGNHPHHAGGMGRGIPMMGGGAMGVNGGRPAMNAGVGGAHGINVGAMGYNPAGHANIGGVGHQNPQGGMMRGGVPMGGVFRWQAAQRMRAQVELE